MGKRKPSGYTDCACRDCFDVSIDGNLCGDCEDADCSPDGDSECQRMDAYGMLDEHDGKCPVWDNSACKCGAA